MATTMGEITKDGEFKIRGNINTRIPAITDGLVAHFPFDGRGGAFDSIKGNQTIQNVETGVNLIEAMNLDWRNPSSWYSSAGMVWDEGRQALKITGCLNTWLKTPIIVDTTKHYRISLDIMEEVQSSIGLYLGGYDTNAAGQCVTSNYDYSYAVNAQPNTGEWTTYRVTRYGTGVISYNNSQTFDTIVGWTGDSSGVTDKLTKFYYFGGLFNYNSGGVMYIKNPSIMVVDSDISNTTVTDDGIAIEVATKNILYNPYFKNGAVGWVIENYSGRTPFSNICCGEYDKLQFVYTGGFAGTDTSFYIRQRVSITASTVYTYSVMLEGTKTFLDSVTASFASSQFHAKLQWLDTNSSTISTAKPANDNFIRISDTELKIAFTGTSPSNATQVDFYCGFDTPNIVAGQFCRIYKPQLEQNTFPTCCVDGSRGAGRLSLSPKLFPQTAGTIVCKAKLGGSTVGKIFSDEDSSSGNSIILNPNNTATFVSQTSKIVSVSNIKNYHHYVYRINSDTSVSCFVDGVNQGLIGTTIYLNRQSFQLGEDTTGSHLSSVYIKDFSIYNRALSDVEIEQLADPTLEITSSGNVHVTGIRSIPNMPSDVYYFPLSVDAKDTYRVYSPSAENNTVYDDTSIWVGLDTKNEYVYPTFYTESSDGGWSHWGQAGSSGTYGQNTDRRYIYGTQMYSHWIADAAGATGDYLLYQSPACGATYRSLTCICCREDGGVIDNSVFYPSWNSRDSGAPLNMWTSVEKIRDTIFYKCKCEGVHQDGSNDLLGVYVKPGYKVYVTSMYLENRLFSSPYTETSRGLAELEFNLYSSLGLDWNGNWSIVYWKKPVGTSNSGNLAGYDLDSLGCNSNSVGGGYRWWGKNTGQDAVGCSGYDNITPSTYFGRWHFISIVKNGSNVTFRWILSDGQVISKTSSMGAVRSDYYVTQYGYDLKLCGWDNINTCNSYYKDLIVAKRALTSTELDDIYKNKMECYDEGVLRIQNSLSTGVTLT